jgi:hypothetical protein
MYAIFFVKFFEETMEQMSDYCMSLASDEQKRQLEEAMASLSLR